MKSTWFVLISSCLALHLQANIGSPQVSNVEMTQRKTGVATVTYDLDEDAVVTAEFLVDGEPIDARNVQTLAGDICRMVTAGTGRSFSWTAHTDWPNHSFSTDSVSVRLTAWPPLRPPDYMVCDLRSSAPEPRIRYYASSNAVPGGVSNRMYKTDYLVMRRIPAAMVRQRQGSPEGTVVRSKNETNHYCTLTRDYYMAVYEFTEAQSANVGGGREDTFDFQSDPDARYYPLTGVYWKNSVRGNVGPDAAPANGSTIKKLRTRTGIDTIDLPTDAQWEYACRAGTLTTLNDGTESGYGGPSLAGYNRALEVAWFDGNAESHPHEVGLKKPNAWGLYDMLGNVAEWCIDKNAPYHADDDVVDPFLTTGTGFILRGGSFRDGTYSCTSSSRDDAHGGWSGANHARRFGFRPMCKIPVQR